MPKRNKQTNKKGKNKVNLSTSMFIGIVILAVVGAATSAYLTFVHFAHLMNPEAASICNFGGWFDCDVVNTSAQSEIFGIPIAYLGLLFYGLVGFLGAQAIYQKDRRTKNLSYLWWPSVVAVLESVYLGVQSVFVLRAFCLFCVVLYLVNISMFALAFRIKRERSSLIRQFKQDLKKLNVIPKRRILAYGTLGVLVTSFLFLHFLSGSVRSSMTNSLQKAHIGKNQVSAIKGQDYGSKKSNATVLLFSDLECPFCEKTSVTFKNLIDRYHDRVRFVFKHYPLDPTCNPAIKKRGHPNACRAARAAICAAQKGKFDAFHQAVFEYGAKREGLIQAAKKSRLDSDELLRCSESIQTSLLVKAEVEDGRLLGVRSTPTYVIGNQLMPGARKEAELIRKIEAILTTNAEGRVARSR